MKKYTYKNTKYPRRLTIAWLILNIIKASGPYGIKRKHIMQILFTMLDKGRYDYELHRGWYCSYFTESRTDYIPYYSYGIIPLLCKKIDGDRWVLKTNINLKQYQDLF